MNESKMLSYADRYKELYDKKAQLQDEMKDIQTEMDAVKASLITAMQENGCEGFNRNGVVFSLVKKEYPSAIPEMKAELYEAMRAHGYEHLFSINAMTLQGTLKEIRENNGNSFPEWLEPLVRYYEESNIRIKRGR